MIGPFHPATAKVGLHDHSIVAQRSKSPILSCLRFELECGYIRVFEREMKNTVALKETKSIEEP